MKKELTVTIQEPLVSTEISIDIATIGWQTTRYKLYDRGSTYPDMIPTAANLYIVRISHKDSLTSSQVYIHHNQTQNSDLNFNVLKHDNTIICEISSSAYPELNKIAQLKDIETDTNELLRKIEKKMEE